LQAAAQRSPIFSISGAECRGRRLLDHLLVAALHGAVALAQVDGVAVLVGQHLDFDVARVLQELLHVDGRIAEGSAGFGLGHLHRIDQRRLGVHHAHAAAAAAAGGLDDHRVADGLGDARICTGSSGSSPSEPGTQGTPALIMACLADTLSPMMRMDSGVGPMN
jgi:hypothetical protein